MDVEAGKDTSILIKIPSAKDILSSLGPFSGSDKECSGDKLTPDLKAQTA